MKPQIEIKLVILKGPHAGQRFSFSKKEITIGRAPENDIVLLNDPLISRQHAKVIVVGSDIEVVNLSQKNSILVQGENVQKWKIINEGTFIVGDTEFQIQFDLGQSVVPVRPKSEVISAIKAPQPQASPLQAPLPPTGSSVSLKNKLKNNSQNTSKNNLQTRASVGVVAPNANANANANTNVNTKSQHLQNRQSSAPQRQPFQQTSNMNFQTTPSRGTGPSSGVSRGVLSNPKHRFYLILVVVAMGAYFYLNLSAEKIKKTEEKKSILKYSDDVAIKLNSKNEKDNLAKTEKLYELKNSPTTLRAEENFIKGMRDFQLGNYDRAQEFFQIVLNLQPNHELAKRHLLLSKVRFDEVLKSKLMLGESNYQKHNFKMCESFYEQVLDMLQGKNTDQNYKMAEAMVKKCKLAAEGVR